MLSKLKLLLWMPLALCLLVFVLAQIAALLGMTPTSPAGETEAPGCALAVFPALRAAWGDSGGG